MKIEEAELSPSMIDQLREVEMGLWAIREQLKTSENRNGAIYVKNVTMRVVGIINSDHVLAHNTRNGRENARSDETPRPGGRVWRAKSNKFRQSARSQNFSLTSENKDVN